MNTLTNVQRSVEQNIDKKIVISSALGAALLGGITYLAVRSGIKPLKAAAKVAKNGSAK